MSQLLLGHPLPHSVADFDLRLSKGTTLDTSLVYKFMLAKEIGGVSTARKGHNHNLFLMRQIQVQWREFEMKAEIRTQCLENEADRVDGEG